jgi:hypothetical protein
LRWQFTATGRALSVAVSHSAGGWSKGKSSLIQTDRIFNRMRISISVGAAIVLVAMTFPRGARAQGDDQFSWGISAGAAVPTNYLAKDHNTGVNAGITMAFGGVGQLFGIRMDGMFNQFGAKSGTTVGSARILGGTVSLVMPVFGDADRVYLIGGVGGYGIRPGVTGQTSNDFGLNGGIGLWLPGVHGFIEARYHHFYRVLADKRPAIFVPITLGILF